MKREKLKERRFRITTLNKLIFQEASNADRPDNERKLLEMLGNVFLEWYEIA